VWTTTRTVFVARCAGAKVVWLGNSITAGMIDLLTVYQADGRPTGMFQQVIGLTRVWLVEGLSAGAFRAVANAIWRS
jgi:hypothetical protein